MKGAATRNNIASVYSTEKVGDTSYYIYILLYILKTKTKKKNLTLVESQEGSVWWQLSILAM